MAIRNVCEDLDRDIRHMFNGTIHNVKRCIDVNGDFLTDQETTKKNYHLRNKLLSFKI